MTNNLFSKFFKSMRNKIPAVRIKLKKSIKKIVLILKISGTILRNFPPVFIYELRRNRKFRLRFIYGMIAIMLILIMMQIPRWYKQFNFRTHFISEQTDLMAVTEDVAQKSIAGKCDGIRKNTDKLYDAQEISEAVANSNGEKITLVGKETPADENGENEDKTGIILDMSGKNVELLCFDFKEKVVVQGDGNMEIGFSSFDDISGNALVISGAKGRIHHNIIEKSEKSGIFADSGQWEISGNIIKNNLSYGVYGGYGADLKIKENFISGNGGYQVRLMGKREVYTK